MEPFFLRIGSGKNTVDLNIKAILVLGQIGTGQTLCLDVCCTDQEISTLLNGMCEYIEGMKATVSNENRHRFRGRQMSVNQCAESLELVLLSDRLVTQSEYLLKRRSKSGMTWA